jgi:hypothetical protein
LEVPHHAMAPLAPGEVGAVLFEAAGVNESRIVHRLLYFASQSAGGIE